MAVEVADRASTRRRRIRRVCAVIASKALLASPAAHAIDDTLGDFEKEVEKRERSESQGNGSSNGTSSGSEADEAAVGAIGSILSTVLDVGILSAASGLEDRRPGAPTTAFVRLENTYQRFARSDVDGLATRGELMLGFIGVGGEFVRYWEARPDQSLEIGSIEGLFRLAPNRFFQLTLAGGSRHIAGQKGHWAHGGGFSLGIHPWRWLGLETDLRWSKVGDRTMGDYRAGLLARIPRFPYLAVRAGYRAIQYQAETLDGPEVGLVGTW
jgi:hypothetical protein